MENAFESTFSQVKEIKSKNVDSVKSQQPDIEVKDNKMSTKQQVAKLSRQHSNKSTIKMSHEDLNVAELERKTFYLKPELAEIFKYAKFKKKLGESQMANIAFEIYFDQQFGKNWRTLLK
jgi:hypothetical protein